MACNYSGEAEPYANNAHRFPVQIHPLETAAIVQDSLIDGNSQVHL